MQDSHLTQSQVSQIDAHGIRLRDIPMEILIEEASFVRTLFLSVRGRQPLPVEEHLLNAILVAGLEVGIDAPGGSVPRIVSATGASLTAALAASILVHGPKHGGAVTAAMNLFAAIEQSKDDAELTIERKITEYKSQQQTVPGFGHHRFEKKDQRVDALFSQLTTADLDKKYFLIARSVETGLEQLHNRPIILNIEGAIAAILLTLEFPPILGDALYTIARVAGSVAHVVETQ
jgi:citrate synthase